MGHTQLGQLELLPNPLQDATRETTEKKEKKIIQTYPEDSAEAFGYESGLKSCITELTLEY
jgi:soluble cytochrome b562